MQNNVETHVIAYPVQGGENNTPDRNLKMSMSSPNANLSDDNAYFNSMVGYSPGKISSNEEEVMNGTFFNQLDSMIAAVKTESSALDQMKEKLKEVDNLRGQITLFTKKLLEADQANLNMKTNILKLQEQCNTLKRQKAETDSSLAPIRTELNKYKELCGKERMARLSAQQEATVLKEHVTRLESLNNELTNENKIIPALSESVEMLKDDLSQLRKKYKDDKRKMMSQIQALEKNHRDVDAVKADVRTLAMKLLDMTATAGAGNTSLQNSVSSIPSLSSVGQGGKGRNGKVQGGIHYQNGFDGNSHRQKVHMSQEVQEAMNKDYSKGADDFDEDEYEDDNSDSGAESNRINDDSNDYDNYSFMDNNSIQENTVYTQESRRALKEDVDREHVREGARRIGNNGGDKYQQRKQRKKKNMVGSGASNAHNQRNMMQTVGDQQSGSLPRIN